MPLVKRFVDICLFRNGPQDLPASRFLLGLVIVLNVLVSVFLAGLEADLPQAMLQSLLAPALLAIFLFGLLKFSKHSNRYTQTLTAGIGGDALITVLAIPLVLISLAIPDARAYMGLLLFALMLWEMAVIGHIIRHAMEIPYMAGLGLALAYTALSYRIMMALFPLT
ncbi:MAG: hypothetical protein LUO80_05210 [Methylococcaceae bacterium]|nr:hypothetical protein [Methylococcaceae bacterium]